MSIEKVEGGFTGYDLACDECGDIEYIDVDWDSPWGEVLAEIKARGYKSVKAGEGWEHLCPSCQKEAVQ